MLIREYLGLKSGLIVLGSLMSALLASSTIANTNLSHYSSVKTKPSYAQTRPEHDRIFQNSSGTGYRAYADAYGTPLAPQRYPVRPQYRHGPHYSQQYPQHYPQRPYPVYTQQNGVTIIYNNQFPTQTEYRTESHGFVNGNGSIESSSYTLISDWQRYHLPAPNIGMHWIFQNGRYLQVPNNR